MGWTTNMAELAVLFRNGTHASANIRYALKCNDIAIAYARTPIQIPIAQQSPELIDLGFYRPSITCTGIVDTVGEDSNNTGNATHTDYKGTAGMASFLVTRTTTAHTSVYSDGGDASAQRYFIPYKNALEEAVSSWIYLSGDTGLEIEIGDAKFPVASYDGYLDPANASSRFASGSENNHATGGAIYNVAIQQARFAVNAAREDRYDFSLQFVSTSRIDLPSASYSLL